MLTWVRGKDVSGLTLQMHTQLYLSHSPLADTAFAY